MADNIITSLFSVSPLKVVNESNGYEYWKGIAVKSVAVMLDTAITDHPISNKSYTEESLYTDLLDVDTRNGKVLRPVKLKITALTDNLAIVESMMGATVDPAMTFRITSKSIIAESLMFTDLTIGQGPEMTSAVEVVMEFEQSEPNIKESFTPENPANRSNFGIRIQLPESTLSGIGSRIKTTVNDLYNKVSSIL